MQNSPSKHSRTIAVVTLAFACAIFAIKFAMNRPRDTEASDLKRFAELGFGAGFEIVDSIVLEPTIMANQGTSLFALRTTAETADAFFSEAAWTRTERLPFSGPNRISAIRSALEIDQHAATLYHQKNVPENSSGTLVLRWDKSDNQVMLLVDVSESWFTE